MYHSLQPPSINLSSILDDKDRYSCIQCSNLLALTLKAALVPFRNIRDTNYIELYWPIRNVALLGKFVKNLVQLGKFVSSDLGMVHQFCSRSRTFLQYDLGMVYQLCSRTTTFLQYVLMAHNYQSRALKTKLGRSRVFSEPPKTPGFLKD